MCVVAQWAFHLFLCPSCGVQAFAKQFQSVLFKIVMKSTGLA